MNTDQHRLPDAGNQAAERARSLIGKKFVNRGDLKTMFHLGRLAAQGRCDFADAALVHYSQYGCEFCRACFVDPMTCAAMQKLHQGESAPSAASAVKYNG